MVSGFYHISCPAKRSMPCHEDSRHLLRISIAKCSLNRQTCVVFVVIRNLTLAQRLRYRNLAAKVVSVRSSHAWDRHTCLGPRGCVLRMGMDNPADLRKGAIKNQVCWQIRRWTIITFNDLALKID